MMKTIEQHPAWAGALSVKEIHSLLAEEKLMTYTLTKSPEGDTYYLSYFNHDQMMRHLPFKKVIVTNHKGVKAGYQNGTNQVFSSVDHLIRFKMKGKGTPLHPVNIRLTA